MADPLLTLIVVTHNSGCWLPGFFESWKKCDPTVPTEIVIADSGSTDDTRVRVAALRPDARVLECGNIGYGAAINRAAEISAAPWLLICNPDLTFPTHFFENEWVFSTGSNATEQHSYAPALINTDGTPQSSTGNFPTIWNLIADQFRSRKNRKSFRSADPTLPHPVPWATGACFFIARKNFQSIGGFDEKFFLYVEEVDLQRRLRNASCRTILCPHVQVTHHFPAASRPPNPQLQRYAARGLLRYFAKHGTLGQLLAYRFLVLFSFRLPLHEAFASRKKILKRPTGP